MNKKSLDKLEFYKKAYADDCIHCMNKEVRIVSAWCVNFFEMYDNKNSALFTSKEEV